MTAITVSYTHLGVGLYDMYFCRGKVQIAGSSTSFYINKEIGNLKDAYYYERADGSNYLVGGAYMEIGEERRFIEKYDYKTGMVTLKSAFTNTPTAVSYTHLDVYKRQDKGYKLAQAVGVKSDIIMGDFD